VQEVPTANGRNTIKFYNFDDGEEGEDEEDVTADIEGEVRIFDWALSLTFVSNDKQLLPKSYPQRKRVSRPWTSSSVCSERRWASIRRVYDVGMQ
jgi:hypothetical protein